YSTGSRLPCWSAGRPCPRRRPVLFDGPTIAGSNDDVRHTDACGFRSSAVLRPDGTLADDELAMRSAAVLPETKPGHPGSPGPGSAGWIAIGGTGANRLDPDRRCCTRLHGDDRLGPGASPGRRACDLVDRAGDGRLAGIGLAKRFAPGLGVQHGKPHCLRVPAGS